MGQRFGIRAQQLHEHQPDSPADEPVRHDPLHPDVRASVPRVLHPRDPNHRTNRELLVSKCLHLQEYADAVVQSISGSVVDRRSHGSSFLRINGMVKERITFLARKSAGPIYGYSRNMSATAVLLLRIQIPVRVAGGRVHRGAIHWRVSSAAETSYLHHYEFTKDCSDLVDRSIASSRLQAGFERSQHSSSATESGVHFEPRTPIPVVHTGQCIRCVYNARSFHIDNCVKFHDNTKISPPQPASEGVPRDHEGEHHPTGVHADLACRVRVLHPF